MIPEGFTKQGAAPGFLLRKPTAVDQKMARLKRENDELRATNDEHARTLAEMNARLAALEKKE